MKNSERLVLSIIVVVVLVSLYSPMSLASHTTCVEDESGDSLEYCRIPEDWMDIFGQVDAPDPESLDVDTTLSSDINSRYRELYQGFGIVLNENNEDILTGRTREVDEADSWWKGGYFDNELGFPPYRYQVHIWESSDSSTNGCIWKEESAGEESEDIEPVEYITIDGGSNSCGVSGGPNPDIVYGPMIDENGGNDGSSLNKFKFDTVNANVDVPDGSRVIINIYKDSGRTDKVTDVVFESTDDLTPGVTRTTKTVSELPESSYDGDYYISVELERENEDVEKPNFGGQVILSRNYPDFRSSSLPYSMYPEDLISSLNRKMYDNYNSKYIESGKWDEDTSITPRLDKSNYASFEVGSGDEHFQTSGNIIHNAYAEIVNIEKSVLTSNVGVDKEYDINGNWRRLVSEEGEVQVVYDSAINRAPQNQNDYSGSPVDGDFKWSYDYSRSDVEYDIEFGYKYIEYSGSGGSEVSMLTGSGASFETETIEEVTRDRPGTVSFDYDMEEIDDDMYRFYVRVDTSVTYDIDYEEYDVTRKDCPSDEIDNTISAPPPGPKGDYDPYNGPSGCSSSAGTYIASEGWENYIGSPSGKDDEVTYSTTDDIFSDDEKDKLQDSSKGILTPDTRTFEDGDFKISKLYGSSNSDRILFNRTTDKDLEDTRWTQLYGTSVSEKSSVDISPSDERSSEEVINVPRVSKVSNGQSDSLTVSTEDDSIDSSDITTDYAIDGSIDGQTVTLDAYVSGPVSASDKIIVYVDDEKAGELVVPFTTEDGDGYETVTDINTVSGDELDISDETEGDRVINLRFEHKGSDLGEDSVRVDFILDIETGEKISQFKSRWGYSTFRDARFDVIYEHNNPCDEEDNCYDYSLHGTPIADSKVNDGNSRGFPDEGGPPSSVEYTYPSGVMPVHAYLIPTTDTLITQRSSQTNPVYPPIATETKQSDDELRNRYVSDLEEIADSGELPRYVELSQVNSPMESILCAEAPVPNDDNEWEHYCDLYSGYLANNTVEAALVDTVIGSERYSEEYEGYDEVNVDKSIDDIESGDGRPNPIGLSRQVEHSDYISLRNETTSEYTELTSFEAVTIKGASSWEISGDATWHTKDVDIDKEEYVIHSTDITVQKVENPRETLSDEKISSLESETVNHQILSEEAPKDVSQFKIRFEDEYDNPISIKDRQFGDNGADGEVDKIRVENARRVTGETGDSVWTSDEFMTNKNGIVYVTADVTQDENNELVVEYDGHTGDWWMRSSSKRLLESTEYTSEISFDENDVDTSNTSILRVIGLFILIMASLFFAISRVLRTYPESNTTVRELFGIMTSPFSEEVKTMFVYMISLIALALVGLLISSTL